MNNSTNFKNKQQLSTDIMGLEDERKERTMFEVKKKIGERRVRQVKD